MTADTAPARPSGAARLRAVAPLLVGGLVGLVVGIWAGSEIRLVGTSGGLGSVSAFLGMVVVAGACVALLVAGLVIRAMVPRLQLGQALLAGMAGLAAGAVLGGTLGPAYLPQMEVAGRLTISLEEPDVVLDGAATCWTEPNTRRVSSIDAPTMGEIGGHRVFGALGLDELEADSAFVEIGQGDEDFPPGSPVHQYGADVITLDLETSDDRLAGSFRLEGLALVGGSDAAPDGAIAENAYGPFDGVDWPPVLGGRVSWTCGEVPDQPVEPSYPAGATGTAVLGGSLVGELSFEASPGSGCPTPGVPFGFITTTGIVDGREARLEITFTGSDLAAEEVALVLDVGDGDKESAPVWRGPGAIVAEEDGTFSALVKGDPYPVDRDGPGSVTLDLRWYCGS